MAAPYTTTSPSPTAVAAAGGAWQPEMRSVTPATNNTRYPGRYASAPRMGRAQPPAAGGANPQATEPYGTSTRSMTPNRFMGGAAAAAGAAAAGAYNRHDDTLPVNTTNNNTSIVVGGGVAGAAAIASANSNEPRTPSSTGLIRLSLKKPMGIVFEPMYDPNQPSIQRGVRICDLPRTGAAALSRKLQVGDELLQINDTTVSRLTFDEIMDFIIEADPESVNLLFRRPRKETLQARQGVQQKLNAATNKDTTTVKWVDEERGSKDKKLKERKTSRKRDPKKGGSKRSKKDTASEEEETIQSSTVGDESYAKSSPNRSRKKSKSRRDPYESESFLDLLIDTICSNSNNVCRDAFRRPEDDSEDEESFATEADEETYATNEESIEMRKRNAKAALKSKAPAHFDDDEPEKVVQEPVRTRSVRKEKVEAKPEKKYEDDGTLETVETTERPKATEMAPPAAQAPLGLEPQVIPTAPPTVPGPSDTDDDGNPAPIKEVEYDDRIDHGADVSVMESLGGPSLLIEKQRAAQAAAQKSSVQAVPTDVLENFGLDYPANFGLTREQTIQLDPLKFYTYVVKGLLEEHEPEKVRLLDKLLAKYRGREDHLVQKLSVRYTRTSADAGDAEEQEEQDHDEAAFTDAVKKSKASSSAAAAVNTAKERMQTTAVTEPEGFRQEQWPEKEQKEPEEGDEVEEEEVEEESESGSDYSKDSVDGTSPAVIAQVSELLNYVYGKTSVPGQIDRVSTIMRAYEGREAVLLELLETKALIKANKEKENAENLPSFLRSTQMTQAQKNAEELGGGNDLPPVTPMAGQSQTGTMINDDISSMSGVSSPAVETDAATDLIQSSGVEVSHSIPVREKRDPAPMMEVPKINASSSSKLSGSKPPATPDKDNKKKRGLFGMFGRKKKDSVTTPSSSRASSSRTRNGRKS